jgi:secretion/DNA translocation related TadE-like protein
MFRPLAKRDSEIGGISLLLIAVVMVLLFLTTSLLILGAAISTQEKLANSADLVALGAANEFLADRPSPCLIAKSLAAKNHVKLLTCQAQDLSVSVEVGSSAKNLFAQIGVGTLTAKAKAGL